MTDVPPLLSRFLALKDLASHAGRTLEGEASDDERAAIAAAFDMIEIQSLTWRVDIRRFGEDGWRLKGEIRARLAQKCVVTLQPVGARLFESFTRDFLPGLNEFEDAAQDGIAGDLIFDFDEDDPPEPLGAGIDLGAILLEHFALGVDPYPRVKGVSFAAARAAPPNVEPLSDEAVKPFAALAALKSAQRKED